jgi:hypothetical protein
LEDYKDNKMASYAYTASSAVQTSGNIATDKIQIATTSSIQYTTSFPNVALTGTITAATNTATVTGYGTAFLSQLNVGAWIGNTSGNTAGIVKAIANNTSLTLTANSAVAIAGATARYNPYGVAYTVATANSTIIPANTVNNSIIVGQGNIVSFKEVSGVTSAPFTITELGAPHPNNGTSGVAATPALGGPTS